MMLTRPLHPALPDWHEDAWKGRKRRDAIRDPAVKRLDEGLHELWETEDHSDKDIHRIQELGLYID